MSKVGPVIAHRNDDLMELIGPVVFANIYLHTMIGIGGRLTTPPLPHHRAYGSVPRRFDRVRLGRAHRFGEDRAI